MDPWKQVKSQGDGNTKPKMLVPTPPPATPALPGGLPLWGGRPQLSPPGKPCYLLFLSHPSEDSWLYLQSKSNKEARWPAPSDQASKRTADVGLERETLNGSSLYRSRRAGRGIDSASNAVVQARDDSGSDPSSCELASLFSLRQKRVPTPSWCAQCS